jgi:hypothetical protein
MSAISILGFAEPPLLVHPLELPVGPSRLPVISGGRHSVVAFLFAVSFQKESHVMWFKSKPKSRQFQQAWLRVESLEGRACPAVGVSVHGHTMLIHGDASANAITIEDDGAGTVTGTIDGKSASGTSVSRIIVIAGAGDDTLDYSLSGALTGNKGLIVDMGRGNDTATLDYLAGIDSGRLTVGIEGGAGDDSITVQSGAIAAGASATFGLGGGFGNDTIDFTSSGDIDGTLRLAARGGAGDDAINLTTSGLVNGKVNLVAEGGNGNDAINVSSDGDVIGELRIAAIGGNGDDTVNVSSSGLINGNLNLEAEGGNGKDTVAANVTIDAGSTGKFRGEVEGGRGDDDLTFNITDNTATGDVSGLAKLKAIVSGGSGNNTLTNTDNVTVDVHHHF